MIRTTVVQVCDRCGKPTREVRIAYKDPLPDISRGLPLLVKRGDVVVTEFVDLCENCERAVANLLEKLTLEKDVEIVKDAKKPQAGDAPIPEAAAKEGAEDKHRF